MPPSETLPAAQQIGGSIGTALLSTLAASAVADRLAEAAGAGGTSSAALAAQAAVHGYTTAFWWAAGIFAVGALICSALLTRRSIEVVQAPTAEPAFAHA